MAARPADTFADRAAIAVLAAVAIVAALTFRDYGLGWDDYTHSQYGDLLLALYRSGFTDDRALSFVNLYRYGGGFDMAAALAAKVLPFDLFETRRLIGAVVGIIGLAATWRLGRRLGGPVAGLAALALLTFCPLYYGHMFMNPKDAPFAVATIALILAAVRCFEEYPAPGARTMVLVGVTLGAAFGSRILAVLAVPAIGAGLMLLMAGDARQFGIRPAAARLGTFLLALLPGFVLAYLIMGLLWPWSVVAPLNPVRAAIYFDTFFEKPWKELYQGHLIAVPDMPASYLPHLFTLKLPVLMLLLGLGGTAGAIAALVRRNVSRALCAGLLTVLLAAYLPVVAAMIGRPALYNGLRHFIFVLPPFAVLGGLAAGWLFARSGKRSRDFGHAVFAAIFAVGVALPAVEMVRLHPYQYSYFNRFAGGVRGAHDNYMLDYWGLAFKQAGTALRDWIAANKIAPPKDRRWIVAICGPQPAANIALGPQFETTFDQKQSDFALALGTFYCRHLRAPIIADIIRDGVSYAVVYDLRGRATPDLLTIPPP